MKAAWTDAATGVFARMDAKAREIVEKRFGVRLDAAQSGEKQQAAWDVYQNATVKILKALAADTRIDDPAGYAATIARNSCRDYWRLRNPGWADLKGRLSRFFRKQPGWAMWQSDEQLGWICGPADWRSKPPAAGSRISELIEQPRRLGRDALPKAELAGRLDAAGWGRLLRGVFDYLDGPARLDEVVSIAGVLFGVKGSREMAFDELAAAEDGRGWDPPAPEERIDDRLSVLEQLRRVWEEIKTMPKRWVLPFLLNPPVLKGPKGAADRGEVAVFAACGVATIAEIEALIEFSAAHYDLLARELNLSFSPDPRLRFAAVWNALPLEDGLIARLMGLESAQKVINLRMVAKNHLAKVLALEKKSARS
ncbi:MAG TPA: sigma factor [Bryobacteraceae bacterium]|jgi:hypothetical protein|nr:sigma factor [Bryobacteraceae bacterium]